MVAGEASNLAAIRHHCPLYPAVVELTRRRRRGKQDNEGGEE